MSKNLCNKTRKVDNPHEIWKGIGTCEGWEDATEDGCNYELDTIEEV